MHFVNVMCPAPSIGIAAAAILASPASATEALLSADTPLATTGGATFTAPTGWHVTSTANKSVLEPPEADSHLVILDIHAADAAGAVAAGWAAYRPDANRPLKIATPGAPYNGWDERHLYIYETSPNDKAVVYALAWRAGGGLLVVIVQAGPSTFEERNAAFALAIGRFGPKSYQRAMFAGREAHPLDADRSPRPEEFGPEGMW